MVYGTVYGTYTTAASQTHKHASFHANAHVAPKVDLPLNGMLLYHAETKNAAMDKSVDIVYLK